jgi:DNA repair protein RecO (recombination protein O)
MAVHYRSQGFVLAKKDLREADQLFVVFTKDFGKIDVLGRAIRRISSKLRSGIDLYYLCEIEFIQGKNYKTLTDTVKINKFKDFETVSRVAQALDVLIRGQEKDEKIWDLLQKAFTYLERVPDDKLTYYYFLWRLISIMGYRMETNFKDFYLKVRNGEISTIFENVLS